VWPVVDDSLNMRNLHGHLTKGHASVASKPLESFERKFARDARTVKLKENSGHYFYQSTYRFI
jgi:hypothetical protein